MNYESGIMNIKNKRNKKIFLLSFLFFIALGNVVYFFPPNNNLIIGFFALVFLGVLFLFSFVFNNTRRGFLIGLGVAGFFFLKYLETFNYFSLVVLVLFLITLELLLTEK